MKTKLEELIAALNADAESRWDDEHFIHLYDFAQNEDDVVTIIVGIGKYDTYTYRIELDATEGWLVAPEDDEHTDESTEIAEQFAMMVDEAIFPRLPRYSLAESTEDGYDWMLTDNGYDVTIHWEDKNYNDNQKTVVANEKKFLETHGRESVELLSKIMNDMSSYLYSMHRPLLAELTLRQQLGFDIAQARRAKGMSIRTLADKVGLNKSTIVNIEAGKFSPRFDSVADIFHALGYRIEVVPVDDDGDSTIVLN